jgi:hypothetical protein
MNHQSTIAKFWSLAAAGKSVALDIEPDGRLYCRYTVSNNEARTEGNGTPPIPAPSAARIAVCVNGLLAQG